MKIDFTKEEIKRIRIIVRNEIGRMLWEHYSEWAKKEKEDYERDLK